MLAPFKGLMIIDYVCNPSTCFGLFFEAHLIHFSPVFQLGSYLKFFWYISAIYKAGKEEELMKQLEVALIEVYNGANVM